MKMKQMTILLSAAICSFGLSLPGYTSSDPDKADFCQQSEADVKAATYGHVDAKGLKILLDSKVHLVLLDGRGKSEWDDGVRVPGAKPANANFTQEEFNKLIPNKSSLVVVYCGAYECPLGRRLADKLIELGYKHVLEYPGGIKEWAGVANYPVEHDKVK